MQSNTVASFGISPANTAATGSTNSQATVSGLNGHVSTNNVSLTYPTSFQSIQQQQVSQTVASQQKDTTFTKIFVGGLPYHTTVKN
jgi:hypothetical protein